MRRLTLLIRDTDLRRELVRAVRTLGYSADEVPERGDFARIVETAGLVALLDVSDATDLALVEKLSRALPKLSIIALALDASPRRIVEAKRAGATEFLRMPFDLAALERAIARSLRRHDAVGDDVTFVARDPVVANLLEKAARAAATEATIRIAGASGTGKSLLAEWIHRHSARASGPLTVVNCAGLSAGLAETELFGSRLAAGGHAVREQGGRVHAAAGGTLVLEDVSELSLALQPRLLRVLQDREIVRVGALAPEPIDVRIIATTQRELEREVSEGRFREDLYYRLDVLALRIPPLRERPADIEPLARAMLAGFARQLGNAPARLSEAALAALESHPFPGNVRELENLMRRAAIVHAGREIAVELLQGGANLSEPEIDPASFNLREIERETILRSLEATGGNRTRAAKVLGISVRTLRNKLQQYARDRRDAAPAPPSAGVST